MSTNPSLEASTPTLTDNTGSEIAMTDETQVIGTTWAKLKHQAMKEDYQIELWFVSKI